MLIVTEICCCCAVSPSGPLWTQGQRAVHRHHERRRRYAGFISCKRESVINVITIQFFKYHVKYVCVSAEIKDAVPVLTPHLIAGMTCEESVSHEIMTTALRNGINFFDHAEMFVASRLMNQLQ